MTHCRLMACGCLLIGLVGSGIAEETELVVQTPSSAETADKAGPAQIELKKQPAASELEAVLASIRDSKQAEKRKESLTRLSSYKLKPIPKEVSDQLFKSAVLDGESSVRKAAAMAIKALDDNTAKQFLFNGALHPKVKANVRENARQAVRLMDDPALVEAIVSIVTLVLRVGTATELQPPQTIFITNGLNVNAPLGNINLPIELPNIEIKNVQTAVATYAVRALRTIAGRDLGRDPAAWKKWYENWKHIRQVRMDQEPDGVKAKQIP